MEPNYMKITDPQATLEATELEIMQRSLPLSGSRILELGCGRAWMTRLLAEQFSPEIIIATEVDRIQHEKNLLIDDLPKVTFEFASATETKQPDASIDVVVMLKSLHHVPTDLMDQALTEIARVLKPGGVAYISEPVYAGDLNDILKLFNDERLVRQAAFDAITRAVERSVLDLDEQIFFNAPGHYRDFDHFEQRMLNVTHTEHKISASLHQQIREAFMQHMTAEGAFFLKPTRVDLLRRPAG
jgi:ubiquinone/menaquinone biosynthesis C-methylase UbiE